MLENDGTGQVAFLCGENTETVWVGNAGFTVVATDSDTRYAALCAFGIEPHCVTEYGEFIRGEQQMGNVCLRAMSQSLSVRLSEGLFCAMLSEPCGRRRKETGRLFRHPGSVAVSDAPLVGKSSVLEMMP